MKLLFSLLFILALSSPRAEAANGGTDVCSYKYGKIQSVVFARIVGVKCTGEGGPAGETIHRVEATGMIKDGSAVSLGADDSADSINSAGSIEQICQSMKQAEKSKAGLKVIGQYYENQNEELPDGIYFGVVSLPLHVSR